MRFTVQSNLELLCMLVNLCAKRSRHARAHSVPAGTLVGRILVRVGAWARRRLSELPASMPLILRSELPVRTIEHVNPACVPAGTHGANSLRAGSPASLAGLRFTSRDAKQMVAAESRHVPAGTLWENAQDKIAPVHGRSRAHGTWSSAYLAVTRSRFRIMATTF